MADQANGGQGNDPLYRCFPAGMPRVMNAVFPMEIVITPNTTYILFDSSTPRRIYTDGRDWPKDQEPNFLGYSVGRWIDENGDGRYDVLEVETRFARGPHSYDGSGLPFHVDDQAWFKERLYLDRANPDILYDEIATYDHALTRPWTITGAISVPAIRSGSKTIAWTTINTSRLARKTISSAPMACLCQFARDRRARTSGTLNRIAACRLVVCVM